MRHLQFLPWSLVACLLLLGCTSFVKPQIVQTGPNAYLLSRASKVMGWGNLGEMKAEVYREVNAFAESKGKVPLTISTKEAPVAWGRYAFFELRFRLVDRNDREARGTALVPRPDGVIEKTEKTNTDVRTKDETEKRPDLYTEIMKLDDLREKGLITDAEFEAQKQKLLNEAK
jgi:hypothetical protein